MTEDCSDELELEKYFAALRMEAPVLSKNLVDGIARDARVHVPARKLPKPNYDAAKPRIWERLFSVLGGPVPAAVLAATVLVGIGLGYGTIDAIAEIAAAQAEAVDGGDEIFAALDELLAEV